MDRSLQSFSLFLSLLCSVGCHSLVPDPGNMASSQRREGLFAKTWAVLRPAPEIEARSDPFPAPVPSGSLRASQLLYNFGPSDEVVPAPKVAASVTGIAEENPLTACKDDSPKLRSLLVEIAETPPQNLRISLAETEKKIASFREDQKNHRAAWIENPQIEVQYLASLREMILPTMQKPKESSDSEEIARKEPVRRSPPVQKEPPEPHEEEDEEDDVTPAPLPPPPLKKLRKEASVAASPPYPTVTQLEVDTPPTPKNGIVQVNYLTESSDGDWKTQARIAADLLRTKIANTPDGRSFANEAHLRLLELVLGNRQEAVRPFPQIDKAVNDFWSSQMLGFTTLLDEAAIPDKKSRLATASFRFDEAVGALRQLCPMKLKNVQFVKDWVAFGVFLSRKEDCQAGETVGLYLELDNPTVKRSAIGYNVRASISYEIRDSASRLVSKSKDIPVEETTPSQKRDYCIHVKIEIPRGLAHGQYFLRVHVTDMNCETLQYAEEQLSFRVLPSTKSYPDE